MKFITTTVVLSALARSAAAIGCVVGGTSCVTLCAGGSAFLNCYGSTCKLGSQGWIGTCTCKCRYGRKQRSVDVKERDVQVEERGLGIEDVAELVEDEEQV